MAASCPDGHPSTASDFCSECGLRMPPADAPPVSAARDACPACGTERDDARSTFCGVCGYNFVTRQGGEVVTPAAARPPASPPPAPTPPRAVSAAPHLDIVVSFDDSDPSAPRGTPPRKFSLYDDESLLGRGSSSSSQTVGLDGDDYISRRHLLIVRQPSGGYAARLFDGTNGGSHNGAEMTAGVEVALTVGDELRIGSFTVVTIAAIHGG